MARGEFKDNAARLQSSTSSISDEVLTIAAWLNSEVTNTTQYAVSVYSAATNDWQMLGLESAAEVRALTYNNGTFDIAVKGTHGTNTWFHGAAVFASSASRTAYLDGVAGTPQTDTNAVTLTSPIVRIGQHPTSTYHLDGWIAHVAIWSGALSADEIADLYNDGIGTDPRTVRPDILQHYWPLMEDSLADWWGQADLTDTGGSVWGPGPPLLMPSGIHQFSGGGGGAPATGDILTARLANKRGHKLGKVMVGKQ